MAQHVMDTDRGIQLVTREALLRASQTQPEELRRVRRTKSVQNLRQVGAEDNSIASMPPMQRRKSGALRSTLRRVFSRHDSSTSKVCAINSLRQTPPLSPNETSLVPMVPSIVPTPRVLPSVTPSPRPHRPPSPSSPSAHRQNRSFAPTPAASSSRSSLRQRQKRGSVRRRDSLELTRQRSSQSKETSTERPRIDAPPVPSDPNEVRRTEQPMYNSHPREAMETASLIARISSIEDRLAMLESESRTGNRRLEDLEQHLQQMARTNTADIEARRMSTSSDGSIPRTPPEHHPEKVLRDSLLGRGHDYTLHRVFEVVNAEYGARKALQADMLWMRQALEQLNLDLKQKQAAVETQWHPMHSRFSTDSSIQSMTVTTSNAPLVTY